MSLESYLAELAGPERTLVDGFAGFRWVGGLEEHVESAASLRDLDLDQVAGAHRQDRILLRVVESPANSVGSCGQLSFHGFRAWENFA